MRKQPLVKETISALKAASTAAVGGQFPPTLEKVGARRREGTALAHLLFYRAVREVSHLYRAEGAAGETNCHHNWGRRG